MKLLRARRATTHDIVSAGLGLDATVAGSDRGGSLRAGSTALMAALKAGIGNELVIASDRRIPPPASAAELNFGPGERLLLAQFGSGCDVMVLETTQRISTRAARPDWFGGGRTESNYLKYLSFTGQIHLDWGMRAEMDNKTALSAAWRSASMTNRFEGGLCRQCGTAQFPAGRICVNPDCGATDTQASYRFADEPARIRSFTCDWLSYRPCPPFMFGHVEFQNHARALMEFVDCEPNELAVGLPLDTVFRIKDFDAARGFRRYFWKVRPQYKVGE